MAATTKPAASMFLRPQIVLAGSGLNEGAQASTIPVLGCAQAITSRPRRVLAPVGMKKAPDTAIGSPCRPVDR